MTQTLPGADLTVTAAEIPDRSQILRAITEAVAGGLPAPMSIDLFIHATSCHVDLTMDHNRAENVDAWARAVSQDADESGVLHDHLFTSSKRPWRIHGYGKNETRRVSWHGWNFSVWSAIDQPEYPAPGSAIPDQPGYVVGECEHRVAFSEWRAGCRTCERCPAAAAAADITRSATA